MLTGGESILEILHTASAVAVDVLYSVDMAERQIVGSDAENWVCFVFFCQISRTEAASAEQTVRYVCDARQRRVVWVLPKPFGVPKILHEGPEKESEDGKDRERNAK